MKARMQTTTAATFYHVDRCRSLKVGTVLSLENTGDIQPPDVKSMVDQMFSGGITSHGKRYLDVRNSL